MTLKELTYFIQSSNINFLFGAGTSMPYLSGLGNVEKLLTDLNNHNDIDGKTILESSIYHYFFNQIIYPNTFNNRDDEKLKETRNNHIHFLEIWNDLIGKRHSRILNKQINIFTTNYDLLIEDSASDLPIEFNDGFKGSLKMIFDETNFMRSIVHTSIHFKRTSEIPVFNLIKIHGSLNWKQEDGRIVNGSQYLTDIKQYADACNEEELVSIVDDRNGNFRDFQELLNNLSRSATNNIQLHKRFIDEYKKLVIVNPTKRKFSETVIDDQFYELMRLYSNSLEKENTVLFVIGFSFADEHIAKITMRAANSNPTLKVIIFAYNEEQEQSYIHNLNLKNNCINNNVTILTPKAFRVSNASDQTSKDKYLTIVNFDLNTVNRVFEDINQSIYSSYE